MRVTVAASACALLVFGAQWSNGGTSDVVARLAWDVGAEEPLSVQVSKVPEFGDALCVQSPGQEACLFRLAEGLHFLGAFPTKDAAGVLVTLWVTGSAYRVVGLHYSERAISVVLDVGAKQIPEFVWLAQDTEPAVIVARPRGPLTASPAGGEAEVHRWTGGRYQLQERVPWARRFGKDEQHP